MRPAPSPRHLVAVLIFAAVAAAEGYLASLEDRLDDTQVNIATTAVKRHDGSLFPHDPIFGDKQFWRFQTPAFQGLLELILVPTDYQDLSLPFRALAGVLTMIYLCGIYALLYGQCRSWSVAAFVAVLSSRVIEALGGGVWGIGPLASITPAGMCLAVLPVVVLAFARYASPGPQRGPYGPWRILLVFAAVGLLGNIHLVTAMNITIVLLIAYVGVNRLHPRCLPVAAAGALSALVAALPYAWYYFYLRATLGRWEPDPKAAEVLQAIRIAELTQLYPELLKSLLNWPLLAGGLVLGLPAIAALGRLERFRTQNLDLWGWLIGGGIFVAMGLHGISQLVGRLCQTAPPVIDFLQASSLVLLPLYVLLAQEVANLFRLLRSHRRLLCWALAALMAAWIIPSDNFRIVRHAGANLATAFMEEANKPSYVIRHQEQQDRARELAAIARWAQGRPNSIFVTDRGEFRALARRPIAAARTDARYLYYLAPGRLGWWLDRYQRQQSVLSPGARQVDGQAVAGFVDELIAMDPGLGAMAEWYAIIPASVAPVRLEAMRPVEHTAWGQHYRLYRIR